MNPVFVVGLPLVAVAFVATLFVERRELRTSVHERTWDEFGQTLFDEIEDEFSDGAPIRKTAAP